MCSCRINGRGNCYRGTAFFTGNDSASNPVMLIKNTMFSKLKEEA